MVENMYDPSIPEPTSIFPPLTTTTYHYQVNGKYRVVIEQAASTKGITGIKVEVNSDSLEDVETEAKALFGKLIIWAEPHIVLAELPIIVEEKDEHKNIP